MNLLDTSTVIDRIRDGRTAPGAISAITLVEILRGVKPEKRAETKELIEQTYPILQMSNDVVLAYCELYDKIRKKGEQLPDADLLITATAMANGLPLETADDHFRRLEPYGLRLVD
jgi:hypothetical protein